MNPAHYDIPFGSDIVEVAGNFLAQLGDAMDIVGAENAVVPSSTPSEGS